MKMKIKICPQCGKHNLAKVWDCSACGATLSIDTFAEIDSELVELNDHLHEEQETKSVEEDIQSVSVPARKDELPNVRVVNTYVTKSKPWYRSTFVMVLLFLFITPAWLLLVLTDLEIETKNKWIAVVVFVVLMACNFWILPELIN